MKFKFLKFDYFTLLISITTIWILINLWYIIYNVYDLNNGGIVDTTTSLQSLLSAFYHEPFLNTVPGGSYFSIHASEILYVLLPFFIIYHNFIDLYIIQSILIYSASIPLFLLAKKKLNNEKAAFFIAAAFLLNPYIQDNPFETLTLFMGFIIYSYYFFDSKKYVAFFITFLLSLSTMEFNPILGITFGIYILLLYTYDRIKSDKVSGIVHRIILFDFNKIKNKIKLNKNYFLFGFVIIIISSLFLEIDSYVVLYFSGGSHILTSNLYESKLSIKSIISSIEYDLNSKVNTLLYLNGPFLFLSFLDPFVILELPWFLSYSISVFSPYWSLSGYYNSYIIPFAAIAAILGLAKISYMLKDNKNRNKLINLISYLVLFVTVILLISNVLIPMYLTPVTSVNSNNYGINQLTSLIPGNASVYTGVNELPIVSSQTPNTWFFGNEKTYILYNVTHPPPLNSYGFLAAYGSHALYEKNYNGTSKFNNLDLYCNIGTYNAGSYIKDKNILSTGIPKGNYKLTLSINYRGDIVKTFNENSNTSLFLNDSYALVYPFTLKQNFNLSEIATNSSMYYGYYILQSMITDSFNGYYINPSSIVSCSSYGHNEDNFKYEHFKYDTELIAGQTYYLWLWSSGYPGGMFYPVENTGHNSSYIVSIYNGAGTDSYGYKIRDLYSIRNSDLSPKISLIGILPEPTNKPTYLSVSINNNTKILDITKNTVINYNLDFDNLNSFNISSKTINGTMDITYNLISRSYASNNNILMEYPYITLAIIILSFTIIYPVVNIAVKSHLILNLNLIKINLILFLILFYISFILFYFNYININLIFFKMYGIIITILLFLYVLEFRKSR